MRSREEIMRDAYGWNDGGLLEDNKAPREVLHNQWLILEVLLDIRDQIVKDKSDVISGHSSTVER